MKTGSEKNDTAGTAASIYSMLAGLVPCLPKGSPYDVGLDVIENVDEVINKMEDITEEEHTWLLTRWLTERNRLRDTGRDAAIKYRWIGLIKVLVGVMVPAIVASLSRFEQGSAARSWLVNFSIIISVVGTLATALEDFFQYGLRATGMKTCVMLMDKEFWDWYALSGMYSKVDGKANEERSGQAFQNFASVIEENIFQANEGYLNTIQAGANKKDE